MARKRPRSSSPVEDDHVVFISSPIEDRGSTHIGLYSPTATAKQLRSRHDVREASHRIAAWRTPGKQRSLSGKPIYDLGHDDDGEQHAGKKLERLLADLNVEGTVIVARCGEEVKRRKIEEDGRAEQEGLAQALEQRDSSIAVLRDLLAEKKVTAKKAEESASQQTGHSPAKKIDYSIMDVPTLRRLEKARDGTLAWILKQIDKAEETTKAKDASAMEKVSAEEAQARSQEVEEAEKESKRDELSV